MLRRWWHSSHSSTPMFSKALPCSLFLAVVLGSTAIAANSSFVQTPLVTTGVDADAQGLVLDYPGLFRRL